MDERSRWGHPVVKKQVYVEGGSRGRLAKQCRIALSTFLNKAGVARQSFQIVACGSRGDAYAKFSVDAGKGRPAILLVDAENPVTALSPWQHLQAIDGWGRPSGAMDDQCHLMVQIMESWFLADTDVLQSFYGRDFARQSLPAGQDIEAIPKQDVLDGLDQATRYTTKGRYKKAHSFELLQMLDPSKVRKRSPHVERFIQVVG